MVCVKQKYKMEGVEDTIRDKKALLKQKYSKSLIEKQKIFYRMYLRYIVI